MPQVTHNDFIWVVVQFQENSEEVGTSPRQLYAINVMQIDFTTPKAEVKELIHRTLISWQTNIENFCHVLIQG